MTYDPSQPATPQPEEPSPVGDAMADAKAAFNKAGFSTPAGMVALAGLIVLGVEILFGLILNEYYVGYDPMVAVALAAVVIFFAKGAYDRIGPADSLLKLTGMLLAGLGVLVLIYDLRFASSRINELFEILGGLLTYGAAVLAFLGARAIK